MERNENGFSGYNFTRGTASRGGCGCPGTGDMWSGDRNGDDGRNNGNGSSGNADTVIGASPQLAMVYAPYQKWRMLYSPDSALIRGTLFEELDKPLEDCVNG